MRRKPLYRKIADDMRAAVTAGRYVDGKLPSDTQLERRYETTRQTVLKAMQSLERDGLILRRPGAGGFLHRPPHGPAAGTVRFNVDRAG